MRHPPLARGSSNTRPTAHVGGRPRGESNFGYRTARSCGPEFMELRYGAPRAQTDATRQLLQLQHAVRQKDQDRVVGRVRLPPAPAATGGLLQTLLLVDRRARVALARVRPTSPSLDVTSPRQPERLGMPTSQRRSIRWWPAVRLQPRHRQALGRRRNPDAISRSTRIAASSCCCSRRKDLASRC